MAGLTSIETRPDGDGDMDHLTATATGAAGLASPAARWTIAFAWVMGVASGVLSAGALVLMEGPTGAVYLFDFASFLVALLIARGNPWHGAVGGAGMVLGGLAWGVSSGAPASVVGQLVALAVMSQVLGVLWRLVLRWVVRRERWHRSEAAQAQRDTAAARHATRLVEEELRQVRVIAQPVLQRIAEGAPMSDDLRRDAAIVEGTVRDRLRAPAFRHPLLVEAIGRLRAQGADVTVVSPQDLEPVSDALAAQIVSALDDADARRLVLRATRVEDGVELTLRQDGISHDFSPENSPARPSSGPPANERWSP